jgi:hypothetical protein
MFFFSVLLILSSAALAEDALPAGVDESFFEATQGLPCDELFAHIDLLNKTIPPEAPFQNELINLVILEGNLTGYIHIQEGVVSNLGCGFATNHTYALTVDTLESVYDIFADDNPLQTYLELKETGAITMEATGFGGKLKLFIANVVAQIMNWFSL